MSDIAAIVPGLAGGGERSFELEDLRVEGGEVVLTLGCERGRVELVIVARDDPRAV